MSASNTELPIGVFDSGVGGLTVLKALRAALPNEHLLYLGDTARLPYGTKSTETITRYALQATAKLVERRIKLLVIACNTATAAALPTLQAAYPGLPVLGVVEPGAKAACAVSSGGCILVLGTESTIRQQAYQKAILALRPGAKVLGLACPLFVALAEEGITEGPVAEAIATHYLAPVLSKYQGEQPLPLGSPVSLPCPPPDCLVLGCTHFPPLTKAIQSVAGTAIPLVDSAVTTALAVANTLGTLGLHRTTKGEGTAYFLTTDAPERFARVGAVFFSTPIEPHMLELVGL